MERWLNKIAVVTGASSGIGAAVVKGLVNAGVIVVGIARRVERVEELKKEVNPDKRKNLYALKGDVSSSESVNEAFDWIINKFGGVDILVNNAGINISGQLATIDVHDVEKVLQTNVLGIVYCTQRAFKSFKERNVDGHVILINSIAGHSILKIRFPEKAPVLNIYSASKYAVTAITETYRQEFISLGTRVKITSVSPGTVETEMVPDDLNPVLVGRILKPEDVANAVLYAIATPPHVQIHELIIKPVGELW